MAEEKETNEQPSEETTFSKEAVIETEGNLPEEAASESVVKPTEITVEKAEEDATDVSTEEIVDNAMKKEDIDKIDAEAKEYLEKHSKEAEIDWDKIEFEDEEKLLPVFTEDDRQVFDICTSPIIYEGMAGKWSEMAKNDIADYKQYLKNKAEGLEDDDDDEYQKSLENSAKSAKELLALLQQESRRMADEYQKNKIAEHGIKDVVTSLFGNFLKEKFHFTFDLHASSQKEIKASNAFFEKYMKHLSDETKKYMFTPVMFDNYIKKNFMRYNYVTEEYFKHEIDNVISAIRVGATILGVENTTTEVNDKGERFLVKKKDPMNVGAFIRGTLEECNFTISAIMYAFILYGGEEYAVVKKSFEKAVGSNDFSKIEQVVGLEGYYDQMNAPKKIGPFYDLFLAVESLMKILQNQVILNDLDLLYYHMMRENEIFDKIARMDDSGVELEIHGNTNTILGFEIKDDDKFLALLAKYYPVVEGKHLGDFPKYYALTLLHARYLTVHELKRLLDAAKNSPEDEAAKKVFAESITNISFQLAMRFISDENKFTYCEFISDVYDFCKSSYDINKLDKNFIFGRILGYNDMGYELGYKFGFDTTNEASGHGLYEHASKILQKKYSELIVEEEEDFLLEKVNLIDVHEKFVKITTSIANFLSFQLNNRAYAANNYVSKLAYAMDKDDFKKVEGFEYPQWFVDRNKETLDTIKKIEE